MTVQLFKWLMALVIVTFLPVILQSCKKNQGKSEAYNKAHTIVYIGQRVGNIFTEVADCYNRVDSVSYTGATRVSDLDKKFCSEDWNKTLEAVREAERENSTDNFFHGFDYWIGETNNGHISVSDISVDYDEVQRGDTASVTLLEHNGEAFLPIQLHMVYEKNDWYIDELTYDWGCVLGEITSVKHEMRSFLETTRQPD